MGLSTRNLFVIALSSIFLHSIPTAQGAPKLRLDLTTVGPVSVASGTNGATQTIQAWNAGDGSLSLTVASNVQWLSPALGALSPCTSPLTGNCYRINVGLLTTTLAKGSYTGTITVSDPNATDAPQFITVTINVGGGVPDTITAYLPPGGTQTLTFSSSNRLGVIGFPIDGSGWMSVNLEAGGTFRFVYTYDVQLNATGLNTTTYNGRITTSGSPLSEENKTVTLALNVTTQPILQVSPASLSFRLMQGAYSDPSSNGYVRYIALSNRGQGSLSITGATPTIQGGGTWLTAQLIQNNTLLQLNFKPGSLAPGPYTATVQIASNAVNSVTIPVEMDVVPGGSPVAYFQGAVNNGAETVVGDDLAQGTIVALFGEHFTFSADASNTNPAGLPQTLNTTRVLVNGNPAPLYYVGYNQVNFQMPFETPLGDTAIQVERDGLAGNKISANVVDIAPRVLMVPVRSLKLANTSDTLSGDYAIAVHTVGNSYAYAWPVLDPQYGIPTLPVTSGELLVIYIIGGGITNPPAQTGISVPSDQYYYVHGAVSVSFGLNIQPAPFGGFTPGFVGLYQVNVIVPDMTEHGGKVPIVIRIGDHQSKPVLIAIQ